MHFLRAWDDGGSYAMGLLHGRFEVWLTPVMHFLTSLGGVHVLGLVTVLSTIFFVLIGHWRIGVCFLAAVLVSYEIDSRVKPWVNRPRPDLPWVEPQDKVSSPGFPSGAALLAMTVYGSIALSLAANMEKRRWKTVVVAGTMFLIVLIGFSRLYLGVHYMSDVLGGFCAGLGCVLFFRWVEQRWSAIARPTATPTTTAAIHFHPRPTERALEQIQQTGGEANQA